MEKKRYIEGLFMGASSFVLWGLLPIYWKLVNAITPYAIFAQRVVWSFVFMIFVLVIMKKTNSFLQHLKDIKVWKGVIAPSIFISINWLLYIWAVNNNYVIETSLGYYINPLVMAFFGMVFYKERLNGLQKIGLSFAAAGVGLNTFFYGKFPIIAITLALCFATYGLLKKRSPIDSLMGLTFETLLIGVPSLLYLIFIESTGHGITGNLEGSFWGLISLSGVVTAVPLLLYGEGTKRLPLSVVGFLQYISPTIALMLGIFAFNEPFDYRSLMAFSLIWIGLLFFSYSQYKALTDQSSK